MRDQKTTRYAGAHRRLYQKNSKRDTIKAAVSYTHLDVYKRQEVVCLSSDRIPRDYTGEE